RTDIALRLARIPEAKEALERARSEIQARGADPAVIQTLTAETGHLARHEERMDDARRAYDDYLARAPSVAGTPPDELLAVRLGLAEVESTTGHRAAADAMLRDADTLAMAHPELAAARFHDIATYRANLDIGRGGYADLGAWLPHTIEECNR